VSGERPEPAVALLRYFDHEHLPEPLAAVSAPFGRLARQLVEEVPPGPERSTAVRKLLEAKDAAVRAVLPEATS
jgi:hypothetical protein